MDESRPNFLKTLAVPVLADMPLKCFSEAKDRVSGLADSGGSCSFSEGRLESLF